MNFLDELPENARIILRVLTKKSKLGLGEYYDSEIKSFLDLKEYKYLRNIYFNKGGISFNEEILDEIGILKEYRIKKPGRDKECGNKLEREIEKI